MRPHAYLAAIAALVTAIESAPQQKRAAPVRLLNEAILEAIQATATTQSVPSSFTNSVRKGAAPIRILNTNNEEMGMSKVVI
eukprot:scaffold20338_cov47-Cyclotella_meneghiniana.AAC.9